MAELLQCRLARPILQMRAEILSVEEARHARIRDLTALRIKKQNGRQAEHLKMLQQGVIRGVIRGYVGLQQLKMTQRFAHARIAKGVFFKLLACHAPVSIEIDHGDAAVSLPQRLVQLRRRGDALKG